MKKLLIFVLSFALAVMCFGCSLNTKPSQIAATTLPVYEFASRLCQDTEITVARLVTEQVSCLHDYSLQANQMKIIEGSQLVIISGGGLEDFLGDAITGKDVIDASGDIDLHCGQEHEGHHHESDPHIWLSPVLAKSMVHNIAQGLSDKYPQHRETIQKNEDALLQELDALHIYGQEKLADLSCRELITFHDGFTYLAECYSLHILEAVEEESGSEASAQELIALIGMVEDHHLPAIFTEKSGSTSAAGIISRETEVPVYTLDMAMSGDSYFEAMYYNIDILKEALG